MSAPARQILFRADAGPAIGAGHVMRCLALAQALRAHGAECHFACACLSDALRQRLSSELFRAHAIDLAQDLDSTVRLARRLNASGLVVDGYHLDEAWRSGLRQALPETAILTYADGPFRPRDADLVVDAASPASDRPSELFGPAFVLLRDELVQSARLPMLPMEERRRILVTFGGTDPAGLTIPVVEALRAMTSAPLDVVIGGGAPRAADVASRVAALGPSLSVHLDPPSLGPLMRRAGLAVSAAGGTIGELAALGVPAIIAIVADNQLGGAEAAVRAGWADAVDARATPNVAAALAVRAQSLWLDPVGRARRAEIARVQVDTGGAARVAAKLLALAKA